MSEMNMKPAVTLMHDDLRRRLGFRKFYCLANSLFLLGKMR